MLTREKAYQLVEKYTENKNLIKHMLAVESSMIEYAKKFGENENEWAVVGLVHDFDYEKMKEKHPSEWGIEILKNEGATDEMIQAVIGHGKREDESSRPTLMAKALFAVDELTGFIVACALLNPKKLEGVEVSSVLKKFGKKEFAKGVNREDIYHGAKELNVTIEEHIQIVLSAMLSIRSELGL
ncbi:HAD family hydrolase [Candidatus Dojkabacteria bacterium]|jgi:predicted hydrolase (HD superfamily)|nr:HAD family hydrolase [Candidatus Dojkabacteria bacterium]